MQNVLSNLCVLFLLLFLVSCAKDNDLNTTELKSEPVAVLDQDDEGPCDDPCQQPSSINVSNTTGCSATVSWSYPVDPCGSFMVQLQNLTTGAWTYYNIAGNPTFLNGLDACTQYKVGVSHVTDLCNSAPLQTTFQTDCEECNGLCETPCQPLDFFEVSNIDLRTAKVEFGHQISECGYFTVQLINNVTNTSTIYDPARNPLLLSGLDPCTSYTLKVSHITDLQACAPEEISFTTECGFCEAEGLDPEPAYFDQFGFDVPGIIDLSNNYLESELYPTQGYMNITSPILRLQPYTNYTLMFCYGIYPYDVAVDTYIDMWIDFNGNDTFEFDEHVLDFYIYNGSLCFAPWTPLVLPQVPGCELKARMMISAHNEINSPCDNIAQGQVVDFLVNIGDCL